MYKIKLLFIFIFLLLSGLHSKDIIHTYTVSISKDLNTLYVKAHFGESDFYYLYAGSKAAARYTQNMHFIEDAYTIYKPQYEELSLNKNAAGRTLSYIFDIRSSIGRERWTSTRKVGDDVVIPVDLWLWRPLSLKENEHIEVYFDFPPGINFSSPWKRVAKNRYRIYPTPLDWPSATAFGTFVVDTVRIKNCVLSVVFMDGSYKTTQKELKEWLTGAARSVCQVYDSFPVDNVQILVFPGRPGREPVPFGMVIRGGGITVNFYIDPSRPLTEFIADWTATHELSHCLLPMTDRNDAWFSEGLATYYQYILMGRDGRLDEQQTWQRIYNGFQKGIRGSKGMTLQNTAEKMRQMRAYRYVYWSGAAIFLKADVALRKTGGAQKSLDSVLKRVRQSLLPLHRSWSGREMMETMDSLAQTRIFADMYEEHMHSDEFPVDENYWAQLGVEINDGQVTLNDKAPLAHIRKNLLKNVY